MAEKTDLRVAIEAEARRLEEGTAHYEQSHRIAANRWRFAANAIGGLAAVAGAVAAGLAASERDDRWYVVVLSALAGAAAAALTFFKPAELAAQHGAASTGFNLLRHDFRRLRLLDVERLNESQLAEKLTTLVDRRAALVTGSPRYSERTYRRAVKRLSQGALEYSADALASGTVA